VAETAKTVAQRAIALFNHEFAAGKLGLDAETRDGWAPEPVIVPFRAALEGNEYRGPQALEDFAADTRESWAWIRIDPSEIRELDEERILVIGQLSGKGRETGAETTAPMATLLVIRGGRVAESRTYTSEREALEAVRP
jgi:ketosteroid isomerase-like protein